MVEPAVGDQSGRRRGRHEDDGGGEEEGVSCSICLELVLDNVCRSRAKLPCGHQFHLDCIGSAFNMKGSMQCPNCQKVEKGQWLYANGSSRSVHELSMDDLIPDEDFYDFGYPEMHYRFHWCPFGELARVGPSFEEVELPSATYHDSRGHHSAYAQNTATSSAAHSNAAYAGPMSATSSESNDTVEDSNLNNHWNGLSGHNEFFHHHLPTLNVQYRSWGRHSPPFSISNSHINGGEPAGIPHLAVRPSSAELDARMRSTAFAHPFVFGHRSSPISGGSLVSSVVPHHPASNGNIHERIHISHTFHHRQQSSSLRGMPSHVVVHGIRRFEGPSGFSAAVPALQQHDHGGGFFIIPGSVGLNQHEAESSVPSHFHGWS